MIGKIFTNEDYQKIVEHCRTSKGSYGVMDHIRSIIKQYGKQNQEWPVNLMEYIEKTYPKIDREQTKIFYKKTILSFKEETPSIKSAGVHYLYSYLKSLINNESNNENILSFKTKVDDIYLKKILLELKHQNFCEFKSVVNVLWIFKDFTKPGKEKIKWIDSPIKKKKVTYQTLIKVLDVICFKSPIHCNSYRDIFDSVEIRFCKADDKPFLLGSFSQILKKYKRKKKSDFGRYGEIEAIISKFTN